MNIRIKEMRKKMHISQTALAEKLGVSLRTVGSWERCETIPDAEQIWNCAIALNCTPNDLLGWYDDHPEDLPRCHAPTLTADEAEVLGNYRECTPEWKRTVAMNALAAKGESLKIAEPAARLDAEVSA